MVKYRSWLGIISLVIFSILLPSMTKTDRTFALCPTCPPKKSNNANLKPSSQRQEKIVLVHSYPYESGVAITVVADPSNSSWKIAPVYFYSPGCESCLRIAPFLERLSKRFPSIHLVKRNIALEENMELREFLNITYNVPEEKRQTIPAIFIGKALLGEKVIKNELEKQTKRILELDPDLIGSSINIGHDDAASGIVKRFKSFRIPIIVFAGLVDGVNPCAIAVLLFFISYLLFTGRKGKEIWGIGILFMSGIFIAYFLIGLGFLKFLYTSRKVEVVSKVIYPTIGFLALILGVFSFIDHLKAKRGQLKKVTLQLPKKLKIAAHFLIAEQTKMKYFLLISFFTGFLISLLEFFCTGQVYLPTLVYVMGITAYKNQAISYLILYNIMFIFPLAFIFIAIALGSSWQNLNAIFLCHISTVKFLTSILFFILSTYMLITSAHIFGYL